MLGYSLLFVLCREKATDFVLHMCIICCNVYFQLMHYLFSSCLFLTLRYQTSQVNSRLFKPYKIVNYIWKSSVYHWLYIDTTSLVSYCQQKNQEFDSVLIIKVVFQLLPCHCVALCTGHIWLAPFKFFCLEINQNVLSISCFLHWSIFFLDCVA